MNPNMNHSFLNGKRVVVFGAGYVGSEVAKAAVTGGAKVVALTRNADRGQQLQKLGCEVVVSMLGSDFWHSEITGCDFSLLSVGASKPGIQGYAESYGEGVQSVLRWAAAVEEPGHMIYTGTTSVYPQDGGVDVHEDDATEASSPQSKLLMTAEELIARWPGRNTVLRLAGIYGPGRHHILDRLRDSHDNTIPGRASTHLNLIHRDDIVSAILAAWSQEDPVDSQIFNLTDNSPPTRDELVRWLCDKLGRSVPAFSGQPAPGRRRISPDRIISNRKIRHELGWSPHHADFRSGYDSILANSLPS